MADSRPVACATLLSLSLAVAVFTDLPAAQAAPFQIEDFSSFGCLGCDGPELFGTIESLWVSDDGSVLVADQESPHLRLFGPTGELVKAFGRRGDGPGELRSVGMVGRLPDGGFLVTDFSARRVTVFDHDSEFRENLSMDGFPTGAVLASDGRMFWTTETNFRDPTKFVMWHGPDLERRSVEPDLSGFPSAETNLPFVQFPMAASVDGRLAIGDGEVQYLIRVFDSEGRTLHEIRRNIARQEKTDEEIVAESESRRGRGRAAASALSGRSGSRGANAEIAALGQGVEIDPLKRHFYIYDLAFDSAGRLWVRASRGGPTETVFDLFDSSGRFLGELVVPARVRRFSLSGGYLAAVVLSELDVQTIKVWKVAEGG